jgi:glutaredoxin
MTAALPTTALALALSLAAPAAHALFKVVGPDGRVTYTDRPPPDSASKVMSVNRSTGSASDASLPFALRQVATRFPVTLYTSPNCDPCAQAREMLVRRGIPFSERVAEKDEEREAWQRVVGGLEAPVLRVGAQMLRGYNAAGWGETLDVAGYPRQSQLPPNYQAPASAPLVERRATAPNPAPPPLPAVPRDRDITPNPGGIRF